MVLTSILLSALAATAMAAPHGTATSMAAPHCTPDARVRPTFFEALNSSCSLPVSLKASPNLPLFGLPPPVNQSLEFIAVGRGIQNYTCTAGSHAAPAAIGAVALLFDASCVLEFHRSLLENVADITLQYSFNYSAAEMLAYDSPNLLGHHFFGNATTAQFDLNTREHSFGHINAAKKDAVNAPATAPVGQSGVTTGAVQWLRLAAESTSTGNITTIYRIVTAGGNPPANCTGQAETLSVQYSAIYAFFS